MKKLLLLGIFVCFVTCIAAQNVTRNVIQFDNGWKFSLGDNQQANEPSFNDTGWRSLNLPHDWSIEGENLEDAPGAGNVGYFPMGIGWYRKTFDVPGYKKDAKYSIEFDGIYMNSDVWINGHHLGKYPYGYSGFSYDLTPYLKSKGNVIAVRVDNSLQPNSRWYTGSGIYRHVKLVQTNALHIEKWGVYVTTEGATEAEAKVMIQTAVINESKSNAGNNTVVKQVLRDRNGVQVGTAQTPLALAAGADTKVRQEIAVTQPSLWSVETPVLYTLETSIMVGNRVIDLIKTNVGIRHIYYDIDKGFLLNGKQVKMKGVNLHHDGGAVGAAVPERVWERRLEVLKAGGCNAIRTAHNIMAPEFMDLCDRMGFLVMDEVFDEWEEGKRDYTYKIYYKDWYERDLLAMVKRDRNHPSVVMWSIGNEMPDQSTARGPMLAKALIDIVHSEDKTRLITSGNDNIAADNNTATQEFLNTFADEIVGYNYADRWHERRELIYSIDRHANPTWRIVGTETGGLGGPRGSYRIGDNSEKIEALYGPRIDTEQRWKFTINHDYVIGDFMWTGIDYYGESRWPSRGATSGMIDNCGFPKDGYYFFKSIWTEEPVLHAFPHWNWPGREGQIMPVIVYTNCDTVELFVNGKSYGQKRLEFPRQGTSGGWNSYASGKVHTSTADLHLAWDVAYEPGELKLIGRKNGEQHITQIFTTGTPHAIRVSVDRNTIKAHPSDVAHVKVEIIDSNGHVVPTADNLVKFEVTGGKLIGVESGNMMDLSSPKGSERKAFGGLCLGIIQTDKAGKVKVNVTSEGLQSSTVDISVIR